MTDAVKNAITSLSKGNTNGFVDAVQGELLRRAQENIKLQKMTVSQTLFDDDNNDLEDDDIADAEDKKDEVS